MWQKENTLHKQTRIYAQGHVTADLRAPDNMCPVGSFIAREKKDQQVSKNLKE